MTDETPKPTEEQLGKLASVLVQADQIAVSSILEAMLRGKHPQSIGSLMLISGIVAEWTARPNETNEALIEEAKGIVESVIFLLDEMGKAKDSGGMKCPSLRKTIGKTL